MCANHSGGSRLLKRHIESLSLVDDHVHLCLRESPSEELFGRLLCESANPFADGTSRIDSQAGFAVARFCSPPLFGTRCVASEYVTRRRGMAEEKIDAKLLPLAGVSDWIVDPGWGADDLRDPESFSLLSGGRVHLLVRLESVAEHVLAAGVSSADFPDEFRRELRAWASNAVGFKTICAYRSGFDIDWSRPDDRDVAKAIEALDVQGRRRVSDAVITSFIVHEAMDFASPIQFHVGLGDRDVDLRHSNPLDMRDLLVDCESAGVPVVLLHCWPFERECGYLCQNFNTVYMDVGLAGYLLGAQVGDSLRRAMELCPFPRLMYSSDAWGLPEQHYVASRLFRVALEALLGDWVGNGSWLLDDAIRVADMIAADNACRLYSLNR